MTDDDYKVKQNQFRQQLQQLLQSDQVNLVLDSVNIFFSSILIFQYIHSTYNSQPWMNQVWGVFNTLIHLYMLTEWCFRLYSVKSLNSYFFSQECLLEAFSLVPFFILRICVLNLFDENNDPIIQFSNLLSLLRVMELNRCRKYLDSEVNKQLLEIILSITTLIVAASGTLYYNSQFLPVPYNQFQYDFFVYFVMTTISTIGFDNPFSSVGSRILIIVLVCFAFTFVPAQCGELIKLLSSKSFYARQSYKASDSVPFIVIMGTVGTIAAENFFKELFHPDHGTQKKHAVLLVPHRPNLLLESLIRSPEYDTNVIYIQGDPLLEKDLRRCQIERAKAVILMCNKQSADANAEDSKTILLAMVIKKYLKQQGANKTRFCMQLLRHEGKTHYYLSLNKQTKQDQVICIEELKMSLLAKSCLCPGLITVISNLISSSGDPPDLEQLPFLWLHQYWQGQGFEIYKTQLPNFFRGKTFTQAVLVIYKKFEAVLFGLEMVSEDNERIFLNPGEMILPTSIDIRIMGYIISQDKGVADEIANYKHSYGATTIYSQPQSYAQKKNNHHNLVQNNTNNESIASRPTMLTKIQTFFGLSPKQHSITPSKISTLYQKRGTLTLPQKQQGGGWIKMKSFNPVQLTNNVPDSEIDQKENSSDPFENDEDKEILEDEDGEDDGNSDQERSPKSKIKYKYKQENFRSFLQTDLNKIDQKCHLTNEKVSLKDVTFKTLEDSILATNHVILCGLVSNLINFVLPLRAKHLSTYPPILILNEHEPTEKQWNQICYFPEIYFVKGTALNQRDLIRANLLKASRVVILSPRVEEISKASFEDELNTESGEVDSSANANNVQGQNNTYRATQQLTRDQEDLLDARTIFKYRNIIKLKPQMQIVTELISPQNLSFLIYDKDYALMKQYGFNQTPIFASGQIYFSSVMDSLLCQAYYNPALITVLYQLLVGSVESSPVKDEYSDVKTSNLFQMSVPHAFLNKSFEKLFYFMVKVKFIVPIGLYRLQNSQDNKQPFIWTNPSPGTILTNKDLLLVLSQDIPSQQYVYWGGPLEIKQQENEKFNHVFLKQTTSTTQEDGEIISLNDDNDKETVKAKQFNNDTEQVMKRIQTAVEDVMGLKKETNHLFRLLSTRQERIIGKMKEIFNDEIQNFIQQRKSKDQEISGNYTEQGSDEA